MKKKIDRDKLGKGVWTEEQEDELRKLFIENQTNPTTEKDVIDWILENLIDQTRTRRSVIKKLKELGLIFKAPTKRSNKARLTEKTPKEFTEEEDSLLAELWKQFGDSSDPMGLIISRMPLKRAKRSFVERLLELGLIQDKKQCRKKREKRHKSKGNSNNDDTSEGSASDSDTDRSDSDTNVKVRSPPKPKKGVKKTEKKKSESRGNKKSKKEIELSANEIAKLLVQAVDKGFSEALRWLAENLEEVALDQEAEGYDPTAEGTPLVPLGEASIQAMDDQNFLKVLKGLGLAPPADEQETYWRIPSHLHHETIRKRREIIIRAVNKELVVDETALQTTSNNDLTEGKPTKTNNRINDDSSDDDDLFDNLRTLRDKYQNDDSNKTSLKSNTTGRKRSRSTDQEDDSREQKVPKIDEAKEQNGASSDDDDILSFAKKTLQLDEPETEDILGNIPRSNMDDNDNDENDEIVLPTKRKKIRTLIDDDSD